MTLRRLLVVVVSISLSGCYHAASFGLTGWNYTTRSVDLELEIFNTQNESIRNLTIRDIPPGGKEDHAEKINIAAGRYRVVARANDLMAEKEDDLSSSNPRIIVSIRNSTLEIDFMVT